MNKEDVINYLQRADYKDKLDIYSKIYTFGNLDTKNMDDRFALISLLAVMTTQLRKKDPDTNPLKILLKLSGRIDRNSHYYQFLESLSIITEDLLYQSDKINSFGLKTSKEIVNKIKELLNLWLPF